MEKKITSPLTKAIIISLVLIVLDLIGGFAHIKFETWWQWIPLAVMCIMLIWACINYANQKDNLVTFGNVFGHGFKTSAILAVIMIIYSLISIYLIFPETIDLAMDARRKAMEAQGNLSEDQIDKGIEIGKKFFLVFAVVGGLIFTLIAGAISSLLGAAFAKKKPVSPFDQPKG